MANMHDYLRWRGDLSFAERPFNDADNLILASFSYLDFTGIVPSEKKGASVSLAAACRKLIDRCGGDIASSVRSLAKLDTRYVELLADAPRFADARLSAYVDVIDEARALQFAAITIELPGAGYYVSYRGTDSTLVGWREDFMLSFCVTEAQREAAAYLQRMLQRTAETEGSVRVGGHSKGGNLAEYAAMHCPADQLGRIVRVYSNDGPGIAPELVEEDRDKVLGKRFKHIVPAYSVIGMLFAQKNEQRIIANSTGTSIGQHDPTTWQLVRGGIDEAPQLQADCMLLNKAIADWAAGIPLEERERAVNEVFDALGAGGATRFDEINDSTEGMRQVIHALGETDERTRELAMTLVEGTVSTSVDALRKAMESWSSGAREMAGEAVRLLQMSGGEVRIPMKALKAKRKGDISVR